jgi:hypothetical protein
LRLSGSRRLWIVPALLGAVIVVALATGLSCCRSSACSGSEPGRSSFRGSLLLGARTRFSELGACLFTCALFGLIHALDMITAQAIGDAIAHMILGMSFYVLRRMSGALTVPIAAHALWKLRVLPARIGSVEGRGRRAHARPGLLRRTTPALFAVAPMCSRVGRPSVRGTSTRTQKG